MGAVYVLWLRELRRYTRSRVQIVVSLGQPMLYLFVMGFGLGAVFQQAGRGSYLQFVAPGIIAMTVLFTSTFSGIALLWDRQFGFLKETLVAPVPRFKIMLGRTCGAATVAMIQGTLVAVICVAAGFRPVSIASLPLAIGILALTAILFAALGTSIGAGLKDMQGFQMVMNFVVMPLYFLSGAMFPLDNLPRALTIATQLNPLSYSIDGLRATLIGQAHFTLSMDIAVLVIMGFVLICFGAWRFSKIEA